MLLFLDFDGVLHPFHRPSGVFSLLPYFEHAMRSLPHVDIVISSAWRETHGVDELRALFSPDIAQRIIDVTPVLDLLEHQYVRETEIAVWRRKAGREHEYWAAIDDTETFFSPRCRNLILVDPSTGFTGETEKELYRRLSGGAPTTTEDGGETGKHRCSNEQHRPSRSG